MKTEDSKTPELRALRAFARYQTHGGYSWAAVMSDGDCLCESCVRENYRQVFRATRDHDPTGWAIAGLTNSGEAESAEYCVQCNRKIWDPDTEEMLPYEIRYLGLEHPDYFQGFGVSFTRFEHSVYGIGKTIKDAYEDALEQIATGRAPSSVVMPEFPDACPIPEDEPLADDDEMFYHVGIRWVNCSVGEMNSPGDDETDLD